ncbi:hypothetical protein ACOSP7_021424 [Xanthoceras sorbifolium]
MCRLCNQDVESSLHAVWDCQKLRAVRSRLDVGNALSSFSVGSVFYFLCATKVRLSLSEFELLCVVFWRNRAIHGQLLLPVGEVCDWACAFLERFQEAHHPTKVSVVEGVFSGPCHAIPFAVM